MNPDLAIAAAIGCAFCNGMAAVVQKISVDKAKPIKSFKLTLLVGLFRQLPYLTGVVLDALAGVLTLVAVHRLPLFTVQTIIASSVAITAFAERVLMRRRLPKRIYWAAAILLAGLALIGFASHSENVAVINDRVRLGIELAPTVLAILGGILVKWNNSTTNTLLAIASGVGFGGVSVVGRILNYPHPAWQVIFLPPFWSIVAYGTLGLYFFTAALQRSLATSVNALMVASETVLPLLVGIFLLGDTARNNLWLLIYTGCAGIVIGSVLINRVSFNALKS